MAFVYLIPDSKPAFIGAAWGLITASVLINLIEKQSHKVKWWQNVSSKILFYFFYGLLFNVISQGNHIVLGIIAIPVSIMVLLCNDDIRIFLMVVAPIFTLLVHILTSKL